MKIILYIIFVCTAHLSFGQDCGVKAENLVNYTGECRKGLAHGIGTASGEGFTYSGEFKKGVPHGEGKILRENGEIFQGEFREGMVYGSGTLYKQDESTIKGFWKGPLADFSFMGSDKESLKGYKILTTDNLNEARIRISMNNHASEKLTIKLSDAKNRSISAVDVSERNGGQISASSITNSSVQIELANMQFPFNGTIRYMVSNESGNFQLPAILKFIITEPGDWTVSITH